MKIVKSEHPEWFNEVEAGKWYNINHGKWLMFVTGLRHGNTVVGYGFDFDGNWRDDSTLWGTNGAAEATPEEVEQALIAEAKRRYNRGDILEKNHEDFARGKRSFGGDEFAFENNTLYVNGTDARNYYYAIFKDGQWASVIPANKPSLQDDIQALKDRWPDINFTVIAEEKK